MAAPGFVRELEAALRALVVFRTQAVGDHDKRLAIRIFVLAAQQHATQFDRRIGLCVRLHFTHHVEVDKNRQVLGGRRLDGDHGIVLILVGPHPLIMRRVGQFAKVDFVVHGGYPFSSHGGVGLVPIGGQQNQALALRRGNADNVVGRHAQLGQPAVGQFGVGLRSRA